VRLPNGDLEWVVADSDPPLRVDHYLRIRLPGYSRTKIQAYIRAGKVRRRISRQGQLKALKASSRLQNGDILQLRRPNPPPLDPLSLPRTPLTVVYEDEAMVVTNKPAGMLVHPTGVRVDNTVIGLMRQHYPEEDIHLGHRIDRETSGALLIARTLEVNRTIKKAFMGRRIEKTYLAVVRGQPAWKKTQLELPIGEDDSPIRVRQGIRADGAPARTEFECLELLGSKHALILARPHTGRLHQIRVHLEAAGLALVGDKIYGSDGATFLEFRKTGLTPSLLSRLGHWRHALHAHTLTFNHPISGRKLTVTAPIPEELQALIRRLEAGGPEVGPADPGTESLEAEGFEVSVFMAAKSIECAAEQ